MTKRVYKYEIPIKDDFSIDLPERARVLTVMVQGLVPCIWALVDPDEPKRSRRFHLAGTGRPIENADSWSYVGTFQLNNGALVFHLFTEFTS